jgi:hypothetical protein
MLTPSADFPHSESTRSEGRKPDPRGRFSSAVSMPHDAPWPNNERGWDLSALFVRHLAILMPNVGFVARRERKPLDAAGACDRSRTDWTSAPVTRRLPQSAGRLPARPRAADRRRCCGASRCTDSACGFAISHASPAGRGLSRGELERTTAAAIFGASRGSRRSRMLGDAIRGRAYRTISWSFGAGADSRSPLPSQSSGQLAGAPAHPINVVVVRSGGHLTHHGPASSASWRFRRCQAPC